MRKKFLGILISIFVIFCGYYIYRNYMCYGLKYTQEYIPGTGNIKGNVDRGDLLKYGEKFDIGANVNGYAVFKNPDEAFEEMKRLFPHGIKAIQREFKLGSLTKRNFKVFATYSFELTSATDEEIREARALGLILDIYENSFSK